MKKIYFLYWSLPTPLMFKDVRLFQIFVLVCSFKLVSYKAGIPTVHFDDKNNAFIHTETIKDCPKRGKFAHNVFCYVSAFNSLSISI